MMTFQHRRFTLIELLVVIAIIAILAGMLLPALGSVKARGNTVTCMSNQKNCIYALTGYADSNEDFYPASLCNYGSRINVGWPYILTVEGYLPKQTESAAVIRCPLPVNRADPSKNRLDYYVNREAGVFGMVQGTAGMGKETYSGSGVYHVRRSNLAKADYKEVPLGGDSVSTNWCRQESVIERLMPSTANRGLVSSSNHKAVHLRHLKKANLFFADGHVSAFAAKDITPGTYVVYALNVLNSAY